MIWLVHVDWCVHIHSWCTFRAFLLYQLVRTPVGVSHDAATGMAAVVQQGTFLFLQPRGTASSPNNGEALKRARDYLHQHVSLIIIHNNYTGRHCDVIHVKGCFFSPCMLQMICLWYCVFVLCGHAILWFCCRAVNNYAFFAADCVSIAVELSFQCKLSHEPCAFFLDCTCSAVYYYAWLYMLYTCI